MKNTKTFCSDVCPWAKRQITQASTWRGLAIGLGTIVTIVNPLAGAAVLKAIGVAVAAIDIVKNDSTTQ